MLCSLLRVIQLYVVSTALFSTSSTIYTDKAFRPVALTHSVVHPPTHTNQTVTVLYQPSYRPCFVKEEMNPPQLIFHASQGFDMKKMKGSSKNVTHTSVIRKPRSKPTKKPVSQSVIKPHHVAVRDGNPVDHSHPAVHSNPSGHSKPVDHSKPVVHSNPSGHSHPAVHSNPSGHSKPVDHSHPAVHSNPSGHSKPVDHSHPAVHSNPSGHPVNPTSEVHSKPVDHSTPSTHPSPSAHPSPSVHPTSAIRHVVASSKNIATFDDQYVSCVKAPQHLHGQVWDSAKQMEIQYNTVSSRIRQCAAECKQEGFTYYAMESGTHCWCAHSQPDASHLNDQMCAPCSDDSAHTCGNVNYGFMSIYRINHPKVVSSPVSKKSVQSNKKIIVRPKMYAHKKYSLLPKLNNIRTFGSKYVSKTLDFDHDLHLDAPPRKIKLDAKLKKESDRLLQKLQRHQARIRRMKHKHQIRRMRSFNKHKKHDEHDEDDNHDDKHDDK